MAELIAAQTINFQWYLRKTHSKRGVNKVTLPCSQSALAVGFLTGHNHCDNMIVIWATP